MISATDLYPHEPCCECLGRGLTVTVDVSGWRLNLCRMHLGELRDVTRPYDTDTDAPANSEHWEVVIRDLRAAGRDQLADTLDHAYAQMLGVMP